MAILRKYPKVKRVDVGIKILRGKHYHKAGAVKNLLGKGDKVIQEKLDGRENSVLINKVQVFYEHLKVKHTIPYTYLPSWNIAFDIWDTVNHKWLGTEGMAYLKRRFGWELTPCLIRTFEPITPKKLVEFLDLKSVYNPDHQIEGIVIKNYSAGIMGKIVNPEFEDAVDKGVHPQKRRIQEYNRLDPNLKGIKAT